MSLFNFLKKDAFQVVALREGEEDRVVGALAALLDDPHVGFCVPGAVLEDLEES